MTAELGIAPGYVLDQMQHYEMVALLDQAWRRERGDWERARFIAYVIAQCQSSKQMKPTDVLALPWDGKNDGEESETSMSEVDRQRLTEMSKQYEKYI